MISTAWLSLLLGSVVQKGPEPDGSGECLTIRCSDSVRLTRYPDVEPLLTERLTSRIAFFTATARALRKQYERYRPNSFAIVAVYTSAAIAMR
jgi:hypothetical protein